MLTPDYFQKFGANNLPGYLGIVIDHVGSWEIRSTLSFRPELMAPNCFLHAGSVVSLADITAGYGCFSNLPEDASGLQRSN